MKKTTYLKVTILIIASSLIFTTCVPTRRRKSAIKSKTRHIKRKKTIRIKRKPRKRRVVKHKPTVKRRTRRKTTQKKAPKKRVTKKRISPKKKTPAKRKKPVKKKEPIDIQNYKKVLTQIEEKVLQDKIIKFNEIPQAIEAVHKVSPDYKSDLAKIVDLLRLRNNTKEFSYAIQNTALKIFIFAIGTVYLVESFKFEDEDRAKEEEEILQKARKEITDLFGFIGEKYETIKALLLENKMNEAKKLSFEIWKLLVKLNKTMLQRASATAILLGQALHEFQEREEEGEEDEEGEETTKKEAG